MADWSDTISSIVFTKIKTEFSSTLKTKYKMTNDNFSTTGSNDTVATFPFVRVKLLPSSERGGTTEGNEIETVLFTFQVDVTDNQSQARAKDVMAEVKRIMKDMRFIVNAMPSFDDVQETHRMTARFRRNIGSNDNL